MVEGFKYIITEEFMKVIGLKTNDMAVVMRGSQTEISIKENIKKGKLMERVYTHGHMGKFTMVNG